ncbi:sigma 54-interacting transcriptional regulator [Sinanaerobacter chloroacetimidivorans]|nr:sigma 54-interacting transcriptional regulator [Sinanaerobacter chloroacetimidivorans]
MKVLHQDSKHNFGPNVPQDALERLLYQNAFLTAILDSLDVGVCFVNKEKEIIYVNKEQLNIHNLTMESVLGKQVGEIFPGTGHIDVLETGISSTKDEIQFNTTGATVRPKYTPIVDGDNNLIGSLAFVKAIEDYREFSIEVKSIKSIYERFSLIFNNLQEAIVAVDTMGKVVYANSAYLQICGEDMENVLKNKLKFEGLGTIAMNTLRNAKSINDNLLSSKDMQLEVISFPIIVDEEVVGCICIIRDITVVQTLTERLERTTHMAEYFKKQIYRQKALPTAFETIIGNSACLKEQLTIAAKAAVTSCRVMIRGSNGAGKELIARAIHASSTRSTGPFIAVNCAALPDALLESELFGYDEGAFTGAKKGGKPGKFELANGGTLFLDEIGDMSVYMQAKLLRILQNMENERIGGTKVQKLDVRVISATNRDLEQMIVDGQFREDLYYRMNVVMVTVPDLKERKGDIPMLSDYFLKKYSKSEEDPITISKEALELLELYDWPGNVRELENVIERSVVFAENGVIQPFHLPSNLWLNDFEEEKQSVVIIGNTKPLEELVMECEKQAIKRAILEAGNNKSKAMEALQLSRRAFYYKLNKYNIS